MKAILQSIRPQHCANIAEGEKTIVVMKTKPNIPTPFKVYIYQNKTGYVSKYNEFLKPILDNCLGKIIGEYVCDEIQEIVEDSSIPLYFDNWSNKTCLTDLEMREYANGKPLYLYHISDLKIYDKPKELGEFRIIDKEFLKRCPYRSRVFNNPDFTNGALLSGAYVCDADLEPYFCRGQCKGAKKPLTRPPRSWCYVEEIKNEHSKNKKELYVMGIALGYCL